MIHILAANGPFNYRVLAAVEMVEHYAEFAEISHLDSFKYELYLSQCWGGHC
jgi:hypothetical protein